MRRQRHWLRPMLVLTGLLLPVALAASPPARPSPLPPGPPGQAAPVVPEPPRTVDPAPATKAGMLTPDHDWVAAIQAGGTVMLGPGEFSTDRLIQVTRSVTVMGAGPTETFILLDSDGGEFLEQFAIVAQEPAQVRAVISGLSLVHGGSYVSDLVTATGPVQVELSDVGVGLAFDDVERMLEGNGDWWGCGILVAPGASLSVEAGYFYGNISGICAFRAAHVSVSASSFFEHLFAGVYIEETPVTVEYSHFEGNDIGIEIYGTASRQLTENTFADQYFQDIVEEE